jgi:hypothetical protein
MIAGASDPSAAKKRVMAKESRASEQALKALLSTMADHNLDGLGGG